MCATPLPSVPRLRWSAHQWDCAATPDHIECATPGWVAWFKDRRLLEPIGGRDGSDVACRIRLVYRVAERGDESLHLAFVDVDNSTVEQLRTHRQRQQQDCEEWVSDYQDQDLVFCKEDGTPIHPHTFSQAFERLIAKTSLPRFRLHDLRHTHATLAIQAGVPVKVISERLGHETPAFTLKQYAHVIPGMQAEAAEAVARLLKQS